jgi:hypothetical protein
MQYCKNSIPFLVAYVYTLQETVFFFLRPVSCKVFASATKTDIEF